LSLIIKTTQFLAYHLLIVVVDRISRLPRSGAQPDVDRSARSSSHSFQIHSFQWLALL